MSYFMTLAGSPIDMRGLEPLELVPALESQEYVRKLAPELSALDGRPLYLVHDGYSGTSHDVVCGAVNAHIAGEPDGGAGPLQKFLGRAAEADHTIRIWWAGNDEAHLRVVTCETLEEALHEISRQARGTGFIGVRVRLTRRSS